MLVNNYDWMRGFSYLDFLRDVGKNFPVNVMLAKDSVRSRLERSDSGLSFTEFSYMLLQAYDFVHLNRQFGCELQIGGSDQWGNITAGIDLARRMHAVQLYGITCPLLTKSDGTKMGKTESGALWLSAERTSPYKFYQYWINVDDADAGKCLRLFHRPEREEIEALDAARAADPGARAKATPVGRGDHAAGARRSGAGQGAAGERNPVRGRNRVVVGRRAGRDLCRRPQPAVDVATLSAGLNVIDAFVTAGLAKSKGTPAARSRRGADTSTIGGSPRPMRRSTPADLASETVLVLRSGKKSYALLRFQWVSKLALPRFGLARDASSSWHNRIDPFRRRSYYPAAL